MKYLFDSSGNFIAFLRSANDRFVFNADGNWIGWRPWDDDDVVTPNGDYLGTMYGDRFYSRSAVPFRGYPGYPGYPGYAGYPGYPGFAGFSPRPLGADDVPRRLLQP